MVVREVKDHSWIVSTQEDHAELSAQFAAHWGNGRFSRLRPYQSMVFATSYHDSGYRDWEGNPPINLEKGRPYGLRETVPKFKEYELQAHKRILDWIRDRDRYAGLLVSTHRTGLWQMRYDSFTSPKGRMREKNDEIEAVIKELEAKQQEEKRSLGKAEPKFDQDLWFNYRMLQVFDILSLYFCCDGYMDDKLKQDLIAPVPVNYESKEEVELHIIPIDASSVKIDPYPFDISPLSVSVRARKIPAGRYASEEEGREVYFKARRDLLSFELSA
jgi:Protein of unknown function (DUF3891)